MKGVKTMSLANGTAKRFQSDDIIAQRIHMNDGIEVHATLKQLLEDNKKLNETVKQLSAAKTTGNASVEVNKELTKTINDLKAKVKDLEDKYNELETE